MDFNFLSLSQYLSPEALIFLVSMLPVSELRGAIPLAIAMGINPARAYAISVLGNMLPVVFLFMFLDNTVSFFSKQSLLVKKFFEWLFEHTRVKNADKFKKWGDAALILFVAIPFPATGAWSGAVAAFVFGISPRKSFSLIFFGVLIAGLIVEAVTLGIM